MNIPDTAFDAADKACQQYGDHQGMVLDDESALSMDQLDLIADAIKAAAPFIAAQALRDEAALLRDKAKRLREEPGVRVTFALGIAVIRDIAGDTERRADELDLQ